MQKPAIEIDAISEPSKTGNGTTLLNSKRHLIMVCRGQFLHSKYTPLNFIFDAGRKLTYQPATKL